MPDRDVVERARTLLEGVTPGPWQLELVDGEPVEHQHYQYDSTDEWYDVDGPHGGWLAHCGNVADARFIAAARCLVPELIAEVERLRQQRTITTVEELDELPVRTLIGYVDNSRIFRRYWTSDDGDSEHFWQEPGGYSYRSREIPLPAIALWLPEWGNK